MYLHKVHVMDGAHSVTDNKTLTNIMIGAHSIIIGNKDMTMGI